MRPQASIELSEAARWLACAAIVAAVHCGAAWALLQQPAIDVDTVAAGAIVLELAPVAIARESSPVDAPAAQDQVQAQPAPEAPAPAAEPPREEAAVDIQPLPQLPLDAADLDALPVQTTVAKPDPVVDSPAPAQPVMAATAATSTPEVEAERRGDVAAAPVQGRPGGAQSIALPRWKTRIETLIERQKRYPKAAQQRREEGTALVAFVIDRQGRLVSATIEKSSGSDVLDAEALEILHRAQPFDPPPAEMPGDRPRLVVPIRFRQRG